MALTQADNAALQKLLEDKMSDRAVNRIIDRANKESFYYDLKDSPLNRPTIAKVLTLVVLFFCMGFFVIYPLFFADKAKIIDLANSEVNAQIERGGMPPISSFTFSATVKDFAEPGSGETKNVLEITDANGEILSKVDLVNGFWKTTFGKLSSTMMVSEKDRETIMNLSRYELEEDKKEQIKDFLDEAFAYDKTKPEFSAIDYGVDTLINGTLN